MCICQVLTVKCRILDLADQRGLIYELYHYITYLILHKRPKIRLYNLICNKREFIARCLQKLLHNTFTSCRISANTMNVYNSVPFIAETGPSAQLNFWLCFKSLALSLYIISSNDKTILQILPFRNSKCFTHFNSDDYKYALCLDKLIPFVA